MIVCYYTTIIFIFIFYFDLMMKVKDKVLPSMNQCLNGSWFSAAAVLLLLQWLHHDEGFKQFSIDL